VMEKRDHWPDNCPKCGSKRFHTPSYRSTIKMFSKKVDEEWLQYMCFQCLFEVKGLTLDAYNEKRANPIKA